MNQHRTQNSISKTRSYTNCTAIGESQWYLAHSACYKNRHSQGTNIYEGMDLQLSTVRGELHAPTALSIEDQTGGLVDPRVSTDVLENTKVSCPCLELHSHLSWLSNQQPNSILSYFNSPSNWSCARQPSQHSITLTSTDGRILITGLKESWINTVQLKIKDMCLQIFKFQEQAKAVYKIELFC